MAIGHRGELLPISFGERQWEGGFFQTGEAQGLSLAETHGDAPRFVQSSVHRGGCWQEAQSIPGVHPFSVPLPPRRPHGGPGLFAHAEPAGAGPGSTASWRRASEHSRCTEKHKDATLSV